MAIKKWIQFFIYLLFSAGLAGQGIEWDERTWEEVLENAKTEDKIIFIDVYTDWCAPCLKMDKDIFPDTSIGSFFNDHFLSLKIDAEDNGQGAELADLYGIKSYPTLLFVDSDKERISSGIGMHTKYELLELAYQTTELFTHIKLLDSVKTNISGDYTLDEIRNILEITKIHDFPGKERLTMYFLDYLKDISESDLRLVMDQISKVDLPYLKRLAPLTMGLSYSEMYVRRNSKEWISWKNGTERAIYNKLELFRKNKDLASFEQTLEILKNTKGIKIREIDNLYLVYYRQNNLDQYRTFATYLIDEHIIPVRPEDVKKADEEKYQMLHNEIMKDMEASMGGNASLIFESNSSPTPVIDSLSQIYSISRSIADQLFEISSDFYAFYDDNSSRRKATFWASLAHLYYPYDFKYFDNHIYILEAQGLRNDAEQVKMKMKALPWYQEMISKNSF